MPDEQRGSGDLASWLLACIAEDEKDAHLAASPRGPDWHIETRPPQPWGYDDDDAVILASGKPIVNVTDYATGAEFHIERHDPARVLAECAAKRRLVEAYQREAAAVRDEFSDGYAEGLGDAVAILGTAYADRPGYAQSWSP